MAVSILTDLTRCVGCKACVYACKEINGLPKSMVNRLDARTWTVVERHGTVNVRRQCMHCLDPACASVCPVAALQKTPEGPVIYEEDRCMGCRYCMVACPFGIPKYEWDEPLPRVQKCILCADKRLKVGKQPACTSVCPAGATVFGDRQALIQEARTRIGRHPGRYVDHIYGLEEAGGTSVIYLSCVPFEKLGFPANLEHDAYPKLTWEILSKIPNIVATGGVMMFGIWWIINRRMELQKAEGLPEAHTEYAPAGDVAEGRDR